MVQLPDVSIIVSTDYSQTHLDLCLRSLAAQTGVNAEIIFVDCASTDSTLGQLSDFADDFEGARARLLSLPAYSSLASVKNTGFEQAKGEYVVFLDGSDQFAAPTALREWLKHARDENCDLCIAQFDTYEVSTGQHTRGRRVPVAPKSLQITPSTWPQLAAVSSCRQILYDREFLSVNGVRFTEALTHNPDRLYALDTLSHAAKISILDLVTVLHAAHENSAIAPMSKEELAQRKRGLQEIQRIHHQFCDTFPQAQISRFIATDLSTYCESITSSWSPVFLSSRRSLNANDMALINSYLSQLRSIFPAGIVVAEQAVNVLGDGVSDAFTVEYCADLLFVLIELKQWDSVYDIISGKRVAFQKLYSIREHFDERQNHIVCRYLAFYRRSSIKTKAREDRPAQLDTQQKRKLMLHVGTPKTGSSAFQNTLIENRITLLEQGVYIPFCGWHQERGRRAHRTAGHFGMVHAAIHENAAFFDDLKNELDTVPASFDRVVVSAENTVSHLLWRGREGLARTAEHLRDFDILVVGIFRNQDDWLNSWFREVTANANNDFNSTPVEAALFLYDMGLLNYPEIQSAFHDIFGPQNCRFFDYQDIKSEGGIVEALRPLIGDGITFKHKVPEFLNNSFDQNHLRTVSILKHLGLQQKDISDIVSSETSELMNNIHDSGQVDINFDGLFLGVKAILESTNERVDKREELIALLTGRKHISIDDTGKYELLGKIKK